MTDTEFVYRYPCEAIPVRLGQPFRIRPDLNKPETIIKDSEGVGEVNTFHFTIPGIGKGDIFLEADSAILEDSDDVPFVTPAGPVRLTYTIDGSYKALYGSRVLVDPRQVPLKFSIVIDDIPPANIDGLFVGIAYNGKLYAGEKDQSGGIENGFQLTYASWRSADSGDEFGELLFPYDEEIISQVSIVIDHSGLTPDVFRQFFEEHPELFA